MLAFHTYIDRLTCTYVRVPTSATWFVTFGDMQGNHRIRVDDCRVILEYLTIRTVLSVPQQPFLLRMFRIRYVSHRTIRSVQ